MANQQIIDETIFFYYKNLYQNVKGNIRTDTANSQFLVEAEISEESLIRKTAEKSVTITLGKVFCQR